MNIGSTYRGGTDDYEITLDGVPVSVVKTAFERDLFIASMKSVGAALAGMVVAMTDAAELIALAALVQAEAVVMAGDNEQRRIEGFSPEWRSGTGLPFRASKLENELERRRVSKEGATS